MGLAALEVSAGTAVFLWGPLALPPLLAVVLGAVPALKPARLFGFAPVAAPGADLPHLLSREEAVTEGALALLSPSEVDRLRFYCAGAAPDFLDVTVDTADGPFPALAPMPCTSAPAAEPWDDGAWRSRWLAASVALAEDIMALYGRQGAAEVARRRQAMLVRSCSRVRAACTPAPSAPRRRAEAGDVEIRSTRLPYAEFFAIEELDLSHRRFDGAMSRTITRAVFLSGDAVTVLPYDPDRDRILLIEQLRAGPIGRGDPQPWLLEAVAGRIDPGETPEEAARREAVEEAGLTLGPMLHVADYYPTPGAKSEWIASYVSLCDLPDGAGGLHGLPGEAEDIRGHLLAWEEAERLVAAGEINNAPLLITLLWLARERPRLRR